MRGKKVLLVEDDAALNDAFTILLSKQGYRVDVAFNGQEALKKIDELRPDVVLLDLLMPIMDGREFLRTFDNKNGIPIIVFSNLDSKDEVKEVLDLGAARFMLKAWATPKELVRVINNTIAEATEPNSPSRKR